VTEAPDFSEFLGGYRAWFAAADGRLEPLRGGPSWIPGTNAAVCGAIEPGRERHAAPAPNCECGLNALHSPARDQFEPICEDASFVIGGVAAWGAIELHLTGFRAQFARIVALETPPCVDKERLRRLRSAARRYRAPLVSGDELPEAIKATARFLPEEELRPQRWLANSGPASVWRRALDSIWETTRAAAT